VAGELAAVPRVLDPAERHPGVGLHELVDETTARLELARDSLATIEVLGPDRRAEAELDVVGEFDRFRLVAHPEHRCDRSERLLARPGGVAGNVREDRRWVVEPISVHRFAAEFEARAVIERALDLVVEIVQQVLAGLRAEVGVLLGRIADLQTVHLVGELSEELVVDVLMDDEPLRGDAGLPGVQGARARAGRGGGSDVGVVEYNERVAPAEL